MMSDPQRFGVCRLVPPAMAAAAPRGHVRAGQEDSIPITTSIWKRAWSRRPPRFFGESAGEESRAPRVPRFRLDDAQRAPRRPLRHRGVNGEAMQRVALKPEDHRGGLLTQASILSLTSDGTRHRPVHRGKWVLESIFGNPPPPPPPNVSRDQARRRRTSPRPRCGPSSSPSQDANCARRAIARSTRSAWRSRTTTRSAAGGPRKPSATARAPIRARPQRRTARRPQVRRRRGTEEADGRRHRQVRRGVHREARHLRPAARHDLRRPQIAGGNRRRRARPTITSFESLIESLVLSDLFQKR